MKQSKGEEAMKDLIDELTAIESQYKVDRFLSSGSYGTVCAGKDGKGNLCAIKRVFTTVSDGRVVTILSDSFLAKRVLREVNMLCHFQHPNILGLRDLTLDLRVPGKEKLYLITELMRIDLGRVISDQRILITPEHIRYFMYHILLGLHTLHEAGVVHRDLHPGNVLLAENNDVKICDFNLAREDTSDNDKTHYVTHRWYRAPELVMQFKGFSKMVDLWSSGCVMAELYNRKALFRGTTFFNQLNKIVEIIGTPKDDVSLFSSPSAREYLTAALSNCPARPWKQIVPSADDLAVDLLSQMLTFNPNKRISAEQALHHPYFSELFDERDLVENLPRRFHFPESVNEVPKMHDMFRAIVLQLHKTQEAHPVTVNASTKKKLGEDHAPRASTFVSFLE